jgi:hypothetical protein
MYIQTSAKLVAGSGEYILNGTKVYILSHDIRPWKFILLEGKFSLKFSFKVAYFGS